MALCLFLCELSTALSLSLLATNCTYLTSEDNETKIFKIKVKLLLPASFLVIKRQLYNCPFYLFLR